MNNTKEERDLICSIAIFFAISLMALTATAQTLPQVCTLRGVIGNAPPGGSTGVVTNSVTRGGTPSSTCSGLTLPSPFNNAVGTYRYNVHYLKNPSIFPICVPIRLSKTNPTPSDANFHLTVFQAPFVAADITNSARFRGDAGLSTGTFAQAQSTTFNVVIPGNSSVALVVTNLFGIPNTTEPYQIDFCTAQTTYNGASVAIPDNVPTGVNVTLPVSTSGRVSDVNFKFVEGGGTCNANVGNSSAAVTHSFIGDLRFRLTAPNGSTSFFMQNRGGARNNICSTLIDDDGNFPSVSTITNVENSTVTGNYSSENGISFGNFDGVSAQGNWVLNVADTVFDDTGNVNKFAVEITTYPRKSPNDFDSDSRTDLSIFRPNVGEWWVMRSSNGTNFATQFGNSSDRVANGDFTGDGISDIAFWRPSSGEWYVLRSDDFSFYAFPFGTNGDIPVPADYDGDTWTDAAIYRPSAGTWYISRSTGGVGIITFGASNDKPVPADYDGDTKADIAVFKPNGQWWLQPSNSAPRVHTFGTPQDLAVPGDYTGDGKADVALWRPFNGDWYIQRSEDYSFYSVPFGTLGDQPVPGDYDGDGRYDTAVFRPSNATWYAQRSNNNTTLIQAFGAFGDIPLPFSAVP